VKHCFGGVYSGRRVLVTGHTGFKGSWLALWLQQLGAEVGGLALAPDTEPSHWRLLSLGHAEAIVDLRDAEAVRTAVRGFAPEIVFHLAAQPLVRRSYREPVLTVATNVLGLVHLLEAAREAPSVRAVVNATTDKCYDNDGRTQGYREDDRLGGHDPYSASKACAEILSASWRRSFFEMPYQNGRRLLLATARAGNVIGGGDWAAERLLPDLVRAAVAGKAALIRNPNATRPWQHVLEPLAGYLLLGRRLLGGDASCAGAWNFGPPEESHVTVAELIAGLGAHWQRIRAEMDAGDHPHESRLLHLDCTKARQQLGWRPVWNHETTLARTAAWYRSHYEYGRVDSRDDLARYVADAAAAGASWIAR
jgi:CDP-glucose 4,6-dehydratase